MLKERQSLLTQNSNSEALIESSEPPAKSSTQEAIAEPTGEKKQRLISLDVLRGLTIIGMLLVDNIIDGQPQWLDHVEWNGLHMADLIFPSFLFIMGMAVPLALTKKKPFRPKNLFRIIALFGIGVLLQLFWAQFNFNELRVMGILQRLSLCYGLLCLIHVVTKYGEKSYRFFGLLVTVGCAMIYMTFMLTFENKEIGCTHQKNLGEFCNFGAYWDRKIFKETHMIYPNDPQGLFTTLSSFINAYAGYWFSLTMFDHKGQTKKTVIIWTVAGALCALTSLPLVWLMPLNKKIWSISYAFLTAGVSGISLALITVLFDMVQKDNKKYQRVLEVVTKPLVWMGRNPLAIFISRDILDPLLNFYIVINNIGVWRHIYHYLFETWISDIGLASILFTLFMLLFFILEAYILFRNNLFLRL